MVIPELELMKNGKRIFAAQNDQELVEAPIAKLGSHLPGIVQSLES
jgi:hypothetical protein